MKAGEGVAADDRRGIDLQAAEQVGSATVGLQARPLNLGVAAQREPAAALEEGELGSGIGAALEGDATPKAVEIDPIDEPVTADRCREIAGAGAQLQPGGIVDEAQRDPVRLERPEPEVARAAVLGVAQAPVAPAI